MSARTASALFAIISFACGSAPTASPNSASSSDGASVDESKDEPSATDIAAAKAGWDRLVKEELVWRRPDLDASCDETRSGHYMASAPEPFEERVVLASKIGCKPVTFVLPGSQSDSAAGASFPGGGYCCPRDLPPAPPPHTGGGKSCEQAVDEYVAGGSSKGESTSVGTYGAILNRGTYFKHCSVPDSTKIEICAAVLDGRAVGVTVRTNPADPTPADCIAKAVVALSFPKNSRMDVTKTSF
jgi:hypothetical protein